MDNIKFNGTSKKLGSNIIFLKLKQEGKHFHESSIIVHAYLYFHFEKSQENVISGLFLSTGLFDKLNPVLLFRKDTKISEKTINNYFSKLPTHCIPDIVLD